MQFVNATATDRSTFKQLMDTNMQLQQQVQTIVEQNSMFQEKMCLVLNNESANMVTS